MSNIIIHAVVTRHLEGHHIPVVSAIIPTPSEPTDAGRDYGDNDLPIWLRRHFESKAREHKQQFTRQFVEFQSAIWMLEVVEMYPDHAGKLPRNILYQQL